MTVEQRTGERSPRQRASADRARRRSRTIRLIAPLLAVLVLFVGTAVAYARQQPDQADPAYLSPGSSADIGGNRLARYLADRGVTVERETKTSLALVHAMAGNTTLFVPTPSLAHPFYLRMIKMLPASTRVVLVAPDRRTLGNTHLSAWVTESRLAAKSVAPACQYPPAVKAGRAKVFRTRYQADERIERCYGGAVTVLRRGSAEVTLVGADDVFRNDRIGESNNADLATELLATSQRLLWLDLHRLETRPGYVEESQPPAPPSLGPGSPDPDFPIPGGSEPDPGRNLGGPSDGGQESQPPNPLWSAFPPWIFATVALLGLGAVLYAVAAGRRVGGPVGEPLPVTVKATETVEGRGRLYQRANARGQAAETLRLAARRRLTDLLGLAAASPEDDVVAAVARASGWSTQAVAEAVFGAAPADDRELVHLANAIEALLQAVTHHASPSTTAPGGTW